MSPFRPGEGTSCVELRACDSSPGQGRCQAPRHTFPSVLRLPPPQHIVVPFHSNRTRCKLWVSRGKNGGFALENGLAATLSSRFPLPGERPKLALEVRDALEVLVDAGEPHIGHVVQLPKFSENLQSHPFRGDLRPPGPKTGLDIRDRGSDLL